RIRLTPLLPSQRSFTLRTPSSPTRRRSVRLSSIAEDSLLLPPVGGWAVSQSQCGRTPSPVGYASLPWQAFVSSTTQTTPAPAASDTPHPPLTCYQSGNHASCQYYVFRTAALRL